MQKVLTPALLQFLIAKGYTHCFSKKNFVCGDASLCVTLMPVNYMPDRRELPRDCDTFYKISEEPVQMSRGIDHTLVLVDIDYVKLEHKFEMLFTIENEDSAG